MGNAIATYEPEVLDDESEGQLVPVTGNMTGTLAAAEIDMQIATAKKYPRSIAKFRRDAESLACLDAETAQACVYSLPRGGKPITGPSARLAEIVMSTFGNCRGGATVVDIDDKFVVARGVFHDLESNSLVAYEVRRRITDKHGKRFNDDMIGVTAAAACSIALRNAVFKGAPKALWKSVYDKCCRMIAGDGKSLAEQQNAVVSYFKGQGIKAAQVAAFCGRREQADLTLDDIVTLRGLVTAIKDGETTLESAFAPKGGGTAIASSLNERGKPKEETPEEAARQDESLFERGSKTE